jgi:hypothetical protein
LTTDDEHLSRKSPLTVPVSVAAFEPLDLLHPVDVKRPASGDEEDSSFILRHAS